MNSTDFFEHIEEHFESTLPFVVYRKPNEEKIHALLQDDETLHEVHDFSESGFVFAPFDASTSETVLIPAEESFVMELDSFENEMLLEAETILVNHTNEDREAHIKLVNRGIEAIADTAMKKVVLSRKQNIPHNYESPVEIFKRLLGTYKTAFVYCWYHPNVGLWLGATPETLLSINNRRLHTMSLAGTQKTSASSDVVWGEKEQEEQQFVTDSIVENLSTLVNDLQVSDVKTQQAGTLLHLKTDISAIINENETSIAAVINALHPTPAVCGLPKNEAKEFILNHEGYARSYYTGFLGELNYKTEKKRARTRRNVENLAYSAIKKHTHLFVNLRCMEVDASGAQLYVGGGVTASSDAVAEWEETVNKLQTVAKVLRTT
ncbi:chorismate-binding protein [uncultured Dokdonia sp.]|uniref:chorismate-binding protein n=1 Tax=Dokdonia sp. R78006 TaxID=3093866 RepID=UPI0026386214|nr:chorismate-binding protein [uncultured Dokdonia sp.]